MNYLLTFYFFRPSETTQMISSTPSFMPKVIAIIRNYIFILSTLYRCRVSSFLLAKEDNGFYQNQFKAAIDANDDNLLRSVLEKGVAS